MIKIIFNFVFSIFFLSGVLSCSQKLNPNAFTDSSYFGSFIEEKAIELKGFILVPRDKVSQTKNYQINQVTKALRFTNGYMHTQGTIYEGYKIAINEVRSFGDEKLEVHFTVTGKALLNKMLQSFEFYIPTEPNLIFERSQNRCRPVDNKSIDQSNFWYHWNPELNGCPLVLNQDYIKVFSQLKTIEPSVTTYPEYERLLVNNEIAMTMFFGPNNDISLGEDPHLTKDLGAKEYLNTKNYLLKNGFSSKNLSIDEFSMISSVAKNQIIHKPFIEEFYKFENGKRIRIRLFYIITEFHSKNSFYFHSSLKYALENEAVVLYSGHSGLGRNLNLKNIELQNNFSFKLSKSYQIIYFGSCIPYAYFADSYFAKKRNSSDPIGTKNLDILIYGKESHFGNTDHLRLIDAIINFAFNDRKQTYQEIIGENPVDYFGVLGDEDNSLPQAVFKESKDGSREQSDN